MPSTDSVTLGPTTAVELPDLSTALCGRASVYHRRPIHPHMPYTASEMKKTFLGIISHFGCYRLSHRYGWSSFLERCVPITGLSAGIMTDHWCMYSDGTLRPLLCARKYVYLVGTSMRTDLIGAIWEWTSHFCCSVVWENAIRLPEETWNQIGVKFPLL